MAPSTPPPPSRVRLAALTMASASSVVMLAIAVGTNASLSRPFGPRFGVQIDRAPNADVVKVLVEETPRRALAADVEHVEEIVIGRKPAERVEMRAEAIEHDAMHVDAAILPGTDATRQPALVDQTRDKIDGAIFGKERRVERDLIDAIHDLA